MTTADLSTRLEQSLDSACAALQTLPKLAGEKQLARAGARVDAAVTRIEEALPFATLGDLRLRAKVLRAWHGAWYGDAPDSLERLLTALESVPQRLWDERIEPA